MKLSLIVPVYNEAGHLQSFLSQIDALNCGIEKELVFVDDCSKDGSYDILKSMSFNSEVQIHRLTHNQGKGAALRYGISQSTGTFIGIQDADFEYSLDEVLSLVEPLIKNKADIVFGSRFKKSGNQVHRTFHYLVNRLLTLLSNTLSGLYLTDMETCYKFFRAEILRNVVLESNRFGFEPEVTAKIARLKVRILELPISYFPRNYMEGKKITWKDGIAAVRHIVYFNLIQNPKTFFKTELPKHYLPSGKQWL